MDWDNDKNNNVDRVTANVPFIDPSRSYNLGKVIFKRKVRIMDTITQPKIYMIGEIPKGPVKSFEEAQVIPKQYSKKE